MKDFNSMTKEELVELLTSIATAVSITEDAGGFCISLMEALECNMND